MRRRLHAARARRDGKRKEKEPTTLSASGRDHGEVGVHGEGAWKAEAGQTCHGGGARRNTKAFKAWVDESAGAWDEGAFGGRGKLGLVAHLEVAAAST